MIRGSLFVQHRFFIFLLLSLFAVMGLFGCRVEDTSTPVVCTPNPSTVNVYRVTPQPLTNLIFQSAVVPVVPSSIATSTIPTSTIPSIDSIFGVAPPSSPPQIQSSRYAALQYLSNETKRWSDIETIKLDDFSEVQIVVTFISPELLQAVFLSEVLEQSVLFPDFEAQTQTMLNSVATRDELLFLLTVTTINSGNINLSPHSIDIPIRQMFLTNGEDLQIEPRHDDHILDQPINSSSKSVFGYLAYPLAVMTNSECKWVLEPKYNTSIVITVPVLQIDGVSSGPYTWTIPYSSLIHPNNPPDLSILMIPPGFDQTLLSPATLPPNGNIEQPNYWQGFARFVWSQVTHGNY